MCGMGERCRVMKGTRKPSAGNVAEIIRAPIVMPGNDRQWIIGKPDPAFLPDSVIPFQTEQHPSLMSGEPGQAPVVHTSAHIHVLRTDHVR